MIIGITGLAGSGKDSAARIIMKKYPSYKKLSFASRLKDMVATLYRWDRDKLEGISEEDRAWREKCDPVLLNTFGRRITPRHEMQLLGTGLKEILQENFWACIVKHEIEVKKLKNVVITDVRFPDEIEMIRSLGGYIIEIQRGILPEWYDVAYRANRGSNLLYDKIFNFSAYRQYLKQHESEKAWIGINKPDSIIFNPTSDLWILEQNILRIMKEIKEKESVKEKKKGDKNAI